MADERDQRSNDLLEEVRHLRTQINVLTQHRPLDFTLPKLTGEVVDTTWNNFLDELYEFGNAHGWTKTQYCAYLPRCLDGEVLSVYRLLPKATRESWEEVLSELVSVLPRLMTPEQARLKLAACRQNHVEEPGTYMLRIQRLAERAYPIPKVTVNGSYTQEQRSHVIINTFRKGLLPMFHAEAIRRKPEATPLRELKKVIDDRRMLMNIEEQKREHETSTTNEEAKAAALNTQVGVERNPQPVCQITEMQTNSRGATWPMQTPYGKHHYHQDENDAKQQRLPNSGIKRRVPRKYRLRGVRRRKDPDESSAQEQQTATKGPSQAAAPLA